MNQELGVLGLRFSSNMHWFCDLYLACLIFLFSLAVKLGKLGDHL